MGDAAVSRVYPGESSHRFVLHDRDTIYSVAVDHALHAMRLRVIKTPAAAPQATPIANA